MSRILRRGSITAALLAAVIAPLAQADDIETLTENLVKLRSEVEALNSELNQAQDEHELAMRTLLSRKGELTNQIKRQNLEIDRLRKALDKARAEASSASAGNDELLPSLTAAIDAMRAYIRNQLPFKREERLAALDELETRLNSGVVNAPRGVNRLWSFYEDELRLARESGLYRQAVEVNGLSQLADVARLGMMALYYRSEDGQVGMAVPAGGDWNYQPITAREGQRQVEALFDALNKNVRTGHFELPNPHAEVAP